MSAMKWAEHELKHVGRIAGVEDPDIQYSYAMSTLYGMLHLKKALTELTNDSAYSVQREDLQRTLDQVIRVIKHLIKDYSLDLNTIQAFNTKRILGDLANVRPPVRVNNTRTNMGAPRTNMAAPRTNMGAPRTNMAATRTNTGAPRSNVTRKNNSKNAPKGLFSFLGF